MTILDSCFKYPNDLFQIKLYKWLLERFMLSVSFFPAETDSIMLMSLF